MLLPENTRIWYRARRCILDEMHECFIWLVNGLNQRMVSLLSFTNNQITNQNCKKKNKSESKIRIKLFAEAKRKRRKQKWGKNTKNKIIKFYNQLIFFSIQFLVFSFDSNFSVSAYFAFCYRFLSGLRSILWFAKCCLKMTITMDNFKIQNFQCCFLKSTKSEKLTTEND